jgi:hypothetical protein
MASFPHLSPGLVHLHISRSALKLHKRGWSGVQSYSDFLIGLMLGVGERSCGSFWQLRSYLFTESALEWTAWICQQVWDEHNYPLYWCKEESLDRESCLPKVIPIKQVRIWTQRFWLLGCSFHKKTYIKFSMLSESQFQIDKFSPKPVSSLPSPQSGFHPGANFLSPHFGSGWFMVELLHSPSLSSWHCAGWVPGWLLTWGWEQHQFLKTWFSSGFSHFSRLSAKMEISVWILSVGPWDLKVLGFNPSCPTWQLCDIWRLSDPVPVSIYLSVTKGQ